MIDEETDSTDGCCLSTTPPVLESAWCKLLAATSLVVGTFMAVADTELEKDGSCGDVLVDDDVEDFFVDADDDVAAGDCSFLMMFSSVGSSSAPCSCSNSSSPSSSSSSSSPSWSSTGASTAGVTVLSFVVVVVVVVGETTGLDTCSLFDVLLGADVPFIGLFVFVSAPVDDSFFSTFSFIVVVVVVVVVSSSFASRCLR